MTPRRKPALPSRRRPWTTGSIPFLLLLAPVWGWGETPAPKPAPSNQEMQELIRQLGAPDFTIREKATARLQEIGAAALPLLEKASASTDPEVRQRAWRLIDQRAADGEVPALLFQLSSQAPPVRAGAAETLGHMEAKAQEALPALIKVIDDPADFVRCSAQEALKKIQATLPLRLDIKQNVESIDLDSTTVYRIDFANQGTAATQVRITAVVPALFTITSVEGQVQHKLDGNKVICEPLSLEANEVRSCEIYVKPKAAGAARLQVEMTADGLLAPVVGEATTTITPPNPMPNAAPPKPGN
jgi:hypothetical protein